eukprot:736479-Rhodomonas_salina.2
MHPETSNTNSCLVAVDDGADVLVLVGGRVNRLGDVPAHGRVVERVVLVVEHVVHDTAVDLRGGEERGHVRPPGALPLVGGVLGVAEADKAEHLLDHGGLQKALTVNNRTSAHVSTLLPTLRCTVHISRKTHSTNTPRTVVKK